VNVTVLCLVFLCLRSFQLLTAENYYFDLYPPLQFQNNSLPPNSQKVQPRNLGRPEAVLGGGAGRVRASGDFGRLEPYEEAAVDCLRRAQEARQRGNHFRGGEN